MKIFGIILAVLLVILALLGVGLQMFLTKGLTTALNQKVFPAVKTMYGLDISITNASVNLFKGTAELNGFAVRNLKGYEEPTLLTFDKCLLEVEMMSLLKRNPVVVKQLTAQGAMLVIERNKEERFNVKELADALNPIKSTKAQAPAPQQTAPAMEPAKAKSIPVHIRRLAVDTVVKYVDSKQNKTNDLNLRLTGSDLFTIPAAGQPNSLLVLRGSMDHGKDNFVTDLNAILEPLTDPANPSFNATGSILDIDTGLLGSLLKKNNLESSAFSIKPSITCAKGRLDGSRIDLVLKSLKIYGTDIGDTTLKLPLNGTLQRPMLDITGAIQSLFSEQGLKIGKTLGLRELKKQLGADADAAPREALLGALTNNVKEISDSPALQQLIEQVAPGTNNAAATTQTLGEAVGNALSEQLDKNVKGFENNQAVKDSLKSLGNSLFGK
ncbi:MAG: hypothetical protein HOO88_00940 [Kiritimatiellaceae bacterium]|nr:hypothetical protein [Kiritimatiellaceae bacterium]